MLKRHINYVGWFPAYSHYVAWFLAHILVLTITNNANDLNTAYIPEYDVAADAFTATEKPPCKRLIDNGYFRSRFRVVRGEGPAQQIENFGRVRSPAGLHAAVILFIALPDAKDNVDPG